jgi:hypothetical protein
MQSTSNYRFKVTLVCCKSSDPWAGWPCADNPSHSCCANHTLRTTKTLTSLIMPKPSSFDKVPTEVFERILSFVPLRGYFEFQENGKTQSFSQMRILLQVSRRFRQVTQRLPCWQHDDFPGIESLLFDPYADPVVLTPQRLLRIGGFYHALLDDPFFLSSLQTKSGWTFFTLEGLFAVQMRIPSFQESVQRLRLSLMGESSALYRISSCSNLSKLVLECSAQELLDLSLIPRCLPGLKILFIKYPNSVSGSLEKCVGLEEFALKPCADRNPNSPLPDPLMPRGSKETLRRITLEGCASLGHVFSFREFTKLEYLDIAGGPVAYWLNVPLRDLPTKLSYFASQVSISEQRSRIHPQPLGPFPPPFPPPPPPPPPPPGIALMMPLNDPPLWITWPATEWQVLSLPSLTELRTIRVEILFRPEGRLTAAHRSSYIDYCMQILDTVTSRMPLLEEVHFSAGLDFSRLHYFNRLANLKRLELNPPAGYIRTPAPLGVEELTRTVTSILRSFYQDAQVKFSVEDWDIRDGTFHLRPSVFL